MSEKRIMSRHVIVDGVDKGLSIVTITADGVPVIEPFSVETHSVSYIDNDILVDTATGQVTTTSPSTRKNEQ